MHIKVVSDANTTVSNDLELSYLIVFLFLIT